MVSAELGVEVRERLVHEEHRRLAHDRPGQRDALALAAGELPRPPVEQVRDLERLGDGLAPGARARALLSAADAQRVADVLAHRHVRVQRVALEDHRDVAVARLHARHVALADVHAPGRRQLEPGERCAAPSSCRSPTARAGRGRRRPARRGRASAGRVTPVEPLLDRRRGGRRSCRPPAGPVELAHDQLRRACSSRPLDQATLGTARSRSSAARAPIAARVLAHGREVGCGGGRPAARRRSRPPRRPRARRGRCRSSESMRSIATPSFMQQMAVGPSSSSTSVPPRRSTAARKLAARRSTPDLAARAGGRRRSAVAEIGEVVDDVVHRLLLVDVDRRPARRSSRPPKDASIVGTPASSRSVEDRRALALSGREDDAVDAAADERAALRRLDLGVAVGVGDQHRVAVAPRPAHDRLRERRGERVDGVGDDEPERLRGALLERPRHLVRPVAELGDGLLDPRARVLGDGRRRRGSTFETVDLETPARRATSLRVTVTRPSPPAAWPPRPRWTPRAPAPGPRARSRRRRRSRRAQGGQQPAPLPHLRARRRRPTKCHGARSRDRRDSARRAPRAGGCARGRWSCPCRGRSRSRSPSASTTASGSTPCHQKWLGSRLMPTFGADALGAARRSCRRRRPSRPGCSSRQMRTSGASAEARCGRAPPRTARPRSRNCHAHSGSSSQQVSDQTAKTPDLARRRPHGARAGRAAHGHDRARRPARASSRAPRRAPSWHGAHGGIGVQQVAGGVHTGELEAVLAQLALQAVALGGARARRRRARGAAAATSRRRPSPRSSRPRSAHQARASRRLR